MYRFSIKVHARVLKALSRPFCRSHNICMTDRLVGVDDSATAKRPRSLPEDITEREDVAVDHNFVADGRVVVPQTTKKKKKVAPSPKLVPVGSLSSDISVWDNALLLIDKPKTWTSFDVCGKLRGALARTLQVKSRSVKVGHAGTLDPMATGLLLVCVGKGTKSIDSFVSMTKQYSGTMKIGEATDSYDADGTVTERYEWTHITNDRLHELINAHFVGEIQQIPPMYSAIRVQGKRLYESARKGEVVERQPRSVRIDRFDLTRGNESEQLLEFWITCSKGTYIRSLAHDLGKSAGCGAHLVALRRECIGDYNVTDAWQMDDLIEAIQQQRKDS